jgi:hypothetical protein
VQANEPFLVAARAAWDGRPDRVADALRPLDKPTQDALRPLLLAGAALAMGQSASTPQDFSFSAAQLHAALAVVERRAELRIENARFVAEVRGFRRFDPLPDGFVFQPGQSLRIYAEITPLVADRLHGGGTGISLSYVMRVKDERGKAFMLIDKKGQETPVLVVTEETDASRGPMAEKHFVWEFTGPRVPGLYSAEIEIRDLHTGRVAKKRLVFRVGGT